MTTETDTAERCPCGLPLHYDSPALRRAVERLVRELGPTIPIHTPYGSWAVPRHFILLHGLLARDLPALAAKYGFARIA